MKNALGILAICLCAALARGQDAKQMEKEAVAAPPSAEAFYNAATTYEKAGDPVSAALNYERALLLDPGLKQARNALAMLATANKIPLPPHRWTDDVNAVSHPDTLALLGCALGWIGAAAFLFWFRARKARGLKLALALLAVVLGSAFVALGWLTDARMAAGEPAMVTAKSGVEVLTAPANNSTAVISLPAGTPVSALSPRGAWTYIDVAGGARGWVQTDGLTPLIPGETL